MTGGPELARSDTFPRRYAVTQRFTLGAPRSFAVAPDGSRLVFVRSGGADDPVGALWVMDLPQGTQRCVADPTAMGLGPEDLPAEERSRRERARESAGGIVGYATDRECTAALFTLGARLFLADLDQGGVTPLPTQGPIVAAHLDPAGTRVAFVRDRALWVCDADGGNERRLAADESPDVVWGLPEFVAAEEMDRLRGFWWAPDGAQLAVARVDNSPVLQWYLGDPVNPAAAPVVHRYPAAGTANADVSLHLVSLEGEQIAVQWDREALPYLVDVVWPPEGPLRVIAQSRDQRRLVAMTADQTGATTIVSDERREPWVELIPGFPRWLADGRAIQVLEEPQTRRLGVDGTAVTPPGLQVRRLLDANEQRVVFTASAEDPTSMGVWSCGLDGSNLGALSTVDGVASAVVTGDVAVLIERRLDRSGAQVTVRGGDGTRHGIASRSETPPITLNATELVLGERGLRGMLLLPQGRSPGDANAQPLPLLVDPYGGPHAQRVVRSHDAHLQSQWFADAGFAVLVVDGRGSPGRGPAWEHTLSGDLLSAPLQDQVDAVSACAEQYPGLVDLGRVAMKGWSFGGFLAAAAVLRRPDVFHAAIAGAPVTDQSLYDTHYTERYLGTDTSAESYRRSSLLTEAANLRRPLLLIHGLADDNVVAAHTLRLSQALLEAGRPHTVLPLSGVTHMTPQEVVAENLLRLQLQFLETSLATASGGI